VSRFRLQHFALCCQRVGHHSKSLLHGRNSGGQVARGLSPGVLRNDAPESPPKLPAASDAVARAWPGEV
jgi:hypothetical protein